MQQNCDINSVQFYPGPTDVQVHYENQSDQNHSIQVIAGDTLAVTPYPNMDLFLLKVTKIDVQSLHSNL